MPTYQETRQQKPVGMVRIPTSWGAGPNTYALDCRGECLSPEYEDGDTVVCDPDANVQPGDFVAVWFKGNGQPNVKRLAMALPPREYWELTGDAEFMLIVEMLNPPRRLSARLRDVEAVHKVIGKAEIV